MRKLLLFFFLILSLKKVNAAPFFVTSNADAGAGTLREAITQANNNGTATTDFIYFNLPGSSVSDITISLLTELPALTSNVVIDATSQPFAALGHTAIKIVLTRAATTYFNGFKLSAASNIEIYGIKFHNFSSASQADEADRKAAIYLYNTSAITIGKAGKPNCFVANDAGIFSPAITPRLDNVNLKISSNIFGLEEDGVTPQSNYSGIEINYLKNSIIGGDTPADGNLISANTSYGIALHNADGTQQISNNIIGLDQTLINSIASAAATGIYITGDNCMPAIAYNFICGQNKGIELLSLKSGFNIATNRIGTSITGTESFGNQIGVCVNACLSGMIGGADLAMQNLIAYNEKAILINKSYPVSILKNSMYCNSVNAVDFENMELGQIVACHINTITANGASGKYLPNSTIELFYTDSCPDCQGKTWIASIQADVDGNWNYTGPITARITSMGTNVDGATTAFSRPDIIDEIHLSPPIPCNTAIGSITKMIAYDVNKFEWTNEEGEVVGHELELHGVPIGNYYLKAWQGDQFSSCDIIALPIEIRTELTVINDKLIDKRDATCGASNGYIKGISQNNTLAREWYAIEVNGDRYLRTANELTNVPPGRYYFTTGQGDCKVRSDTYVIFGSAIQYQLKEGKVINSSCGRPNGSIRIIGHPSSATFTFKWFDINNVEIGTTDKLENLLPGKYRLMAYTLEGCESSVGEFTVYEDPLPTINDSDLKQYLSCDGKAVSTTGINVSGTTGPFQYLWKDKNGNAVSNELNLNGVPPGIYALQVKDRNSCVVESSFIDFTTLKNSAIEVPNSITPNDDGLNDIWQIKGVQNYRYAEFSIYARDGNRVFYSIGYAKPFDGFYKGKPLPVGVYYYVIDLKTDCPTLTGSLTILR